MTGEPVVAVLEPGYADYETERAAVAPFGASVLPVAAEADSASALAGKHVVAALVRERRVDSSVINACPALKIVLRYGVGIARKAGLEASDVLNALSADDFLSWTKS